ncbi:MAG: flavodoxin domain-containing protein [Candidatus Bathyarchaeota archaeon]|jgi:NAD(P)H dehydrogenase (quinone)|nr:flavodoxin domain-containing protein [Candidatus Bathyarchaeota archaeon]
MVKALVLYHSQQVGNTGKMAEAVAEGLKGEKCEVTLHNTNEGRFDITKYPQYDCIALGTPDYFSYMAGTIKTFMDDWYIKRNEPGYQQRPYVVFFTHGGGGKAKESFTLFNRLGTQIGKTVECQGTPNAQTLKMCKALGTELAKAVKK